MNDRLDPSRALLHPAWLASLAVLALNDHVLKGAGLLPGVLTGKLSDVVGLMVAPLLLAALLRVRSRRAFVACHVAVGVVFAAIQLSADAAALWSAAMGLVGFPWVITRDATDLLALPMLAVSVWVFVPAMRKPAVTHVRKAAQYGAASVGLLCSVATSQAEEPWEEEPWPEDTTGEVPDEPPPEWDELPPFDADVYLSNQTGQTQVVRIRALRPDVELDCTAVAEAPGELLRSSLFQPALSWTMPPDVNVPVLEHLPGQDRCYAALVEADRMSPVVLWWQDGQPPSVTVPGQGRQGLAGELTIEDRGFDGIVLGGATQLVFDAEPIDPPATGECAPQADGDRLAWSTPVPWGSSLLEAVELGADGCFALDLRRTDESLDRWYLCVPATSFPFTVGDRIDLQVAGAVTGQSGPFDGILMAHATEPRGPATMASLLVSAGTVLPAVDLDLAVVPSYSCEIASEPVCGTVERPLSVVAGAADLEAVELHAGQQPTRIQGIDRTVELTLLHAQERFVVDPTCAMGPSTTGLDVEIAIAQWAN